MKWSLSFFLLLSTSLYALELEKVKQEGETFHSQKFILANSSNEFLKKSNYFDEKENYEIGHYEISQNKIEPFLKNLNEIVTKIKNVDSLLNSKGKSFNELSLKDKDHLASFNLEGFIITKDSNLFSEVESLFKSLKDLDWKMKKGIRIKNKFTQVDHIKNNKIVETREFKIKFSCKKPAIPTICYDKEFGYLLLGK